MSTPLHLALDSIKNAKICSQVVKILVEAGADVNVIDKDGWTPIFFRQSPETLKYLIDNGANINVADKNGNTPLIHAIDRKILEDVKILLDHGAEIEYNVRRRKINSMERFCEYAEGAVYKEIASLLIDRGANITDNFLSRSAKGCINISGKYEEHGNFIFFLMDKLGRKDDGLGNSLLMYQIVYGDDCSDMSTINSSNKNGLTPLMLAVRYRNIEFIQMFLSNGADINAQNDEDATPLSIACCYRDLNMIKFLVEAGANINPPGFMPLRIACIYKEKNVIEYLLKSGAKVIGEAVKEVCIHRDLEILKMMGVELIDIKADMVSYILSLGVDPNEKNIKKSPLYFACKYGTEEMIRLLVDAGADVNSKSSDGGALYAACVHQDASVVKLLLDRGPLCSEEFPYNPLLAACQRGELEIIKLLVGAGYNINNTDLYGCVIERAVEAPVNSLEIVKYLVESGLDSSQYMDAMGEAIHSKKFDVMEYFVSLGVEVDKINLRHGKYNILSKALHNRDKKMMDFLIKHGVKY